MSNNTTASIEFMQSDAYLGYCLFIVLIINTFRSDTTLTLLTSNEKD